MIAVQILVWTKFLIMQAIAMTEELLATAKQNQNLGLEIGTSGSASPSFPQSQKNENVSSSKFSLFLAKFMVNFDLCYLRVYWIL